MVKLVAIKMTTIIIITESLNLKMYFKNLMCEKIIIFILPVQR